MSNQTSSSSVNQYLGQAQTVPTNAVLGNIVWFTISVRDVDATLAENTVANLGLKKTWLKTDFRPVDAFRKASKEIEKSFPRDEDRGTRSTFLVRPVGQDSDMAHRHVILERTRVQKGKKRRLLYDRVAEIVFHRGTKKNGTYSGYHVELNRQIPPGVDLTTQEETWLDIHLKSFNDRFNHYMTHLDHNAIRDYVRRYLTTGFHAIPVKESGGVYFVSNGYKDESELLAQFVESMGSSFHSLPLIDLDEQREMVITSFTEETVDSLQKATDDLAQILKSPDRTIRQKTFTEMANYASEVIQKADEIEALLGRKADRVRQEVEMYKKQLLALTSRVE